MRRPSTDSVPSPPSTEHHVDVARRGRPCPRRAGRSAGGHQLGGFRFVHRRRRPRSASHSPISMQMRRRGAQLRLGENADARDRRKRKQGHERHPSLGSAPWPWPKMEKELPVAGRAGDRRRRHRRRASKPSADRVAGDLGDHRFVHGRIGHESAFADFVAPGLELRLDERDDVGAVARGTAAAPGRMCRSEMNATSIVTTIDRVRQRRLRVSARALTPSRTTTRGSLRSFQSSWPWPTSSAIDVAARRAAAARR